MTDRSRGGPLGLTALLVCAGVASAAPTVGPTDAQLVAHEQLERSLGPLRVRWDPVTGNPSSVGCEEVPVVPGQTAEEAAWNALRRLGVHRLLTSGVAATAAEGIPVLRDLVTAAGGALDVIAGAGIRPGNVRRIVRETGVRDVHFSGSVERDGPMEFRRESVAMGGGPLPGEYARRSTSVERLEEYLAALGGGR